MLELLLCSVFTVLPDYLYRRYVQGKRIGREINLFSVWYELRYGLVSCLMLALTLITIIFYFHPTAANAVTFYRTTTILPETNGRVAEIFVKNGDSVTAGQPLFRLDNEREAAALDAAKARAAEVDAALTVAEVDLRKAESQLAEAESAYQQAKLELDTRTELGDRNSAAIAGREIERQQITVQGRLAAVDTARAAVDGARARLTTVLPAQKASADAQVAEAQVALDHTMVRAGVDGSVEQFFLRVGDIVNPMLRPAGILVPKDAGKRGVQAGFDQLEAQVIRPGLVAEVSCISVPFTIIPMVVSETQNLIATGQVRASDQIIDAAAAQARVPGTLLVNLEPLYEGGLDKVMPGSTCMANVYTDNHERLASGEVEFPQSFWLHAIDATGVLHAIILRIHTALLPVQMLVLSSSGH